MTKSTDFDEHGTFDVSVVLACLNEEESVGDCVGQALRAMEGAGISGEVVVADNGSTDDSVLVARAAGARVVHEPLRGYGHAYLRGFAAARGRFIVMGDADASYDFGEVPRLVDLLREGYDYVVGSRFTGQILPGSMPWTHRYVGNPVLTGILNRVFGTRFTDAHSGLRAMTREAYVRLDLSCDGMEFASEIAIRTAQAGLRTAEIPISYHPRVGDSKLRPIRDGVRHVSFMVRLVPGLRLLLTGFVVLAAGCIGLALVQPGLVGAGRPRLAVALAIMLALVAIVGAQVTTIGVFVDLHVVSLGRAHPTRVSESLVRLSRSKLVLAAGIVVFVLGLTAELTCAFGGPSFGLAHGSLERIEIAALTSMILGLEAVIALRIVSTLPQAPSNVNPIGAAVLELERGARADSGLQRDDLSRAQAPELV